MNRTWTTTLAASLLASISLVTLTLQPATSALPATGGVTYEVHVNPSVTSYNSGMPFNIAGSNGLYWPASTNEPKCILVCVHGMSLCAESFTNFGEIMSARGMSTYSVQLRGFGKDQERPGRTKVDLDRSIVDIQQLVSEIHRLHPDKPVFLVGESLGGCLGFQLAALCPDQFDGVICSAPAWHSFQFKRTILRGLVDTAFNRNKRIGWAAEDIIKLATHDQRLLRKWEGDPDYRYKYSFSEEMHGLRFMKETGKVARKVTNEPMLVLQGLDDRLVRSKGTADLFKRIPCPDKELVLVGNNEHLSLQEVQPKHAVIDVVSAWLNEKSAGNSRAVARASSKGILIGSSKLVKADKLFHRAGLDTESSGLAMKDTSVTQADNSPGSLEFSADLHKWNQTAEVPSWR
jgi:acylglycerol lipase